MRGAFFLFGLLALAGPTGARAAGAPAVGEVSIAVGDSRGPAPPPDSRAEAWRARVDEGRRTYEAYAARAYERYLLFSGAKARRAANSSYGGRGDAAILNDPTLRPNDIYVSEHGFMVFRGGLEPPYDARDFQPLPTDRVQALSLRLDSQPK